MKNIIKSAIFILIFIFIFNFVFSIIWLYDNAISYFYDEPKNSIDVVYIGGSNAYAHFNTTLAYNLYGFTTGLFSTDSQPFPFVKYLMIDALKKQEPKLFVIDTSKFVDDVTQSEEGAIRLTSDTMKFSLNRINAISNILSYNELIKDSKINYYFSFLKYHNRWKELTKLDFTYKDYLYKGYLFNVNTEKIVPQEKNAWLNDKEELPEKNVEELNTLIRYIKENNLNVLFAVPVRNFTEDGNKKMNSVIEIIEKNNLKILNMNNIDEIDINYSTDLYNSTHINVYGATKYTAYFSKYLIENYDLPNHKNDKNYKSWEEEYERFKRDFKDLTNKDYDELLKEDNII